jgi:hypothetical protein
MQALLINFTLNEREPALAVLREQSHSTASRSERSSRTPEE